MMLEECAKRGVGTGYADPDEPPLVLMPKGGMSHRGPNDINKIEAGDVLVIDFSIRYYGYTSDIARTMYFLKPGEAHAPQEIQDVANAAIEAVGNCMAMIKPGVKGCEVDHVGRSTILSHGYPEFFHSIQMGANIDYAIVISSHYTEMKGLYPPKQAIIEALNSSFPTIFTSGTILASAGMLIERMTTNPVIAAIGQCLGRGTVISMVLVLAVLPQILVLGDTVIERTSFEMPQLERKVRSASGTMRVKGRVRGYISGMVDAEINGVLTGQINAAISTDSLETIEEHPAIEEGSQK